MLPKLITFIKENYPDANLSEWLDSKYIHLSDAQLKKVAQAVNSGELSTKPASACPASQLIFHFGSTLILIKKDDGDSAYLAELAWETDFKSTHSVRDKDKGFHFINFSFDDDFETTMLPTQKTLEGIFIDEAGNQKVIDKSMPILKAFVCAIT